MTGMSNVTKLAGEPSGQEFLVFTLGDEEYGIDILKVQEIRGYDDAPRDKCAHFREINGTAAAFQ